MRKQLLKTVRICNKCGSDEHVYERCLECGLDHCYECKKQHGIEYNHAVNFGGSDDGYYCKECNEKLLSSRDNELHLAYLKIKKLRAEEQSWYAKFKSRKEKAETRVKTLLKIAQSGRNN